MVMTGRIHGRTALICAWLTLATLAVYWPVARFDFVSFDDVSYVKENAVVARGLTAEGVAWAFTTFEMSNWHPLTWISYLLDVELFGVFAPGHHLVNLALHAANSVLVFAALRSLTGAALSSALVATLFAVHPQHVESVAWISERKDVLSVFFGLLAVLGYRRYVDRPGPARYLAVVFPFGLGLLAKPVLVTLPALLLLLDFWPLSRWGGAGPSRSRVLAEKVPLLALSALSAAATYAAQAAAAAMTPLEGLSMASRVGNALTAYARYLGKAVAPVQLGLIYPYATSLVSPARVAAAVLLLAAISACVWRRRGSRPYLLVGWLWFLGALVPMIGLVQVGVQSMADRYTYVPHIGLFAGSVWWAADLLARRGLRGARVVWPVAGLVALLGTAAHAQVRVWRDGETLYRHTLAVTQGNWKVHTMLGRELERTGRVQEAVEQFRLAAAIEPLDFESRLLLGNALYAQGSNAEALAAYGEAARLRPKSPRPLFNMGLAWIRIGNRARAEECFRMALWVDPGHERARTMLASLLAQGGGPDRGRE